MFDLRAASPYGSPNEAPYLNNEAMEEDGPADQNLLNIWTQQNPDTPLPVVRFGAAGTATEVELPSGDLVLPIDRWPCILAPGDEAMLSDGFTDHSTMIYRIEADKRLVTFIDPRAEENFLLSANSLLQDFGGRWFTEGDRKLFSVPFDTMGSVLKEAVLFQSMDGKTMIETAAALAPGVARPDLYYWRDADFFATMDASQATGDIGYLLDPQASPLVAALGNYVMALSGLTGHQHQGLLEGFDEAIQAFPHILSRNLNFRILYELYSAGEYSRAASFADYYLKVRGFNADFAVIGAAACHGMGDSACAEDLRAQARAELDPRLGRMFRGETFAEDRAMLDRRDYENASIYLMRRRYEMLESW
ncbi:hypothetical protein [Mesorhizobium sp. 43Arga]